MLCHEPALPGCPLPTSPFLSRPWSSPHVGMLHGTQQFAAQAGLAPAPQWGQTHTTTFPSTAHPDLSAHMLITHKCPRETRGDLAWPGAGERGFHTVLLPEQVSSRAHEGEMLPMLWARQAGKDAAGGGGGGVTTYLWKE